MDDEMEKIEREDVVDAINDPEQTDALELLELYYEQENAGSRDVTVLVANALEAATLLFDVERYEDVVEWIDAIATKLSDEEGPDSELYMAFAENEELEELKMKATDKIFGNDTEEEDDDYFNDDDE